MVAKEGKEGGEKMETVSREGAFELTSPPFLQRRPAEKLSLLDIPICSHSDMALFPTLPFVPTEIKGHILSFCDQSTLAKTSSLSIAFLQLSSPLLYEDVVIHGVRNIHKLFCEREVSVVFLLVS